MSRTPASTVRPVLVSILIASALALPAHAASSDSDYAAAVAQFKSGRMSDAYGRFIRLADEGDPDAARIALFMYRFGPILYGSHWDAHPDDIAYWNEIATKATGRPAPTIPSRGYVPMAPKAKPKAKGISQTTYR